VEVKMSIVITRTEIQLYEEVRASKTIDMYSTNTVMRYTGFTRETVLEIRKNYEYYIRRWNIQRA